MCATCGCGGDHAALYPAVSARAGAAPLLPAAAAAQVRRLRVERDLLAQNDAEAARTRAQLERSGIFSVNLLASPGAGKTTLLERTLIALRGRYEAVVIEGDQQTSLDAERIRATGTRAVQVNTGKGCHLEAGSISRAVAALAPTPGSLLFIENVGNLVCPAGFDLGEARKVVLLSVAEGADKPLKYPDAFRAAKLMLVSKADLLPHVDFDLDSCIACARRVHPGIEVLTVSATRGDGMADWLHWLEAGLDALRPQAGVPAAASLGPSA